MTTTELEELAMRDLATLVPGCGPALVPPVLSQCS